MHYSVMGNNLYIYRERAAVSCLLQLMLHIIGIYINHHVAHYPFGKTDRYVQQHLILSKIVYIHRHHAQNWEIEKYWK